MPDHQSQSHSRCSLLLTLVSSISVTSIHGSHSVRCGDDEPQNFFQLTRQCVAIVEGSLVEHQFFLLFRDSLSLFHVCIISQQMFQILHFLVGNPLDHGLKYGIFRLGATQSVTCRFTGVWMALAWTAVSWTCLCISSSASATAVL